MKYNVIVLITDKMVNQGIVKERNLNAGEYPSKIALKMANECRAENLLVGMPTYLGCECLWHTEGVLSYVFHIFSDAVDGFDRPKSARLLEKYRKKISTLKCSFEWFSEVKPADLVSVTKIPLSESFDKNALSNGSGFIGAAANPVTGCLNFPESINFMGMNTYLCGVPRGNHFHFHKVEYTYILKGKIQVDVCLADEPECRMQIIVKPGDLLLLLPGSYHSLTALTETAYAMEVYPQSYEPEDYYYRN